MKPRSIAEKLFFSTVRIDTLSEVGGMGSGTGFFFTHVVDGQAYPFVVTNKHVVMDAKRGRFSLHVIRGGDEENREKFELLIDPYMWRSMWVGHPDPNVDIAVAAFNPILVHVREKHGAEIFAHPIDTSLIPDAETLEELDANESVVFIGYPNGLWDETNFLPIMRRGMTATPMQVDFEGTPRFLIDASVFGGSSGSPVFILNQGAITTRNGGLFSGTRFLFVGVVAATYLLTSHNKVVELPVPTSTELVVSQQERIDIGVVFKAHTVVEAIEWVLRANKIIS